MIQPQSDELGVAPDISVRTLKDFCSWALEKWKDEPGQVSLREKALCAAREAAEVIAGLAKARRSDSDCEMALDLTRLMRESGIHAGGYSAANLARAQELRSEGWAGIVASMLLVPAWAFQRPLTYDAVPRWLWAEYTRYLFAVPLKAWASELANAYASNMRQSLDMLVHLCRANRGSIAVQAARSAYFEQQGAQVLAAATCPLSDCIALRSKITNFDLTTTATFEPGLSIRSGRALRLGVCLPSISDTSAARSVLAMVQHLPEERFDIHYFVLEYTYGRLEESLRAASANITLMDGLYPQQNLEMASLDAALLLIDPLEAAGPLMQLGYRRFAPLQIATNLKGTPTGLPEIDLFIGTERSAAVAGAERLGILPVPSTTIRVGEPSAEPSLAYTRNALGIPETARILGSIVSHRTVSFEMMQAWAGILSANPSSHLLLHLYSDSAQDDEEVLACCREIDAALVARGIATERLTILGTRQTFFEDWVALMKVADVHLDSYPCSNPLAVAAALTASTPGVSWTGDEPRMRSGALMLEAENLGANVAVDLAHCIELAGNLLSSDRERAELRRSLEVSLGEGMAIHDSLGASDAVAGLVEAAFDEVFRTSTQEFKSARAAFSAEDGRGETASLKDIEKMVASGLDSEALTQLETLLSSQPLRLDVRRLMGQVLARCGMHKRAIPYQRAALRKAPRDAKGWFEFSKSLFRDDRVAEACRVLHQSLKLDPSQPDAWFFMGELTINSKDEQGARSIIEVLRKIAPSDDRLADLERLAADLAGARAAETELSLSGPEVELMGMRSAMRPKIGLIQSRGIGDIIIALPIAKFYSDRGYDVYWPIDQRFAPSFSRSVDYVNFIPFKFEANAQGFIHLPKELLKKAGCERCISLYSYLSGDNTSNKAYFNSLKFDEYKYAVAGVPFGEKWNLSLKRDADREDRLYRQLVTQDDYVVVHQQGSNFKAKFNIPAPHRNCQVIEIAERTDNILDWLGILEKARLLIMIDSCFSNLVEQLGFENEKVYALRSDVRFTPVLRGNWQYYGQLSPIPASQVRHQYEMTGT